MLSKCMELKNPFYTIHVELLVFCSRGIKGISILFTLSNCYLIHFAVYISEPLILKETGVLVP